MNAKEKIIITCLPGTAEVLEKEIKALGFPIGEKKDKSIETEGTLTDTYLLNYALRTANRVLYRVFTTGATHPDHLYKKARNYPWENIIYKGSYLSIDSFVQNKFIKDTRFANLRLKDAIADRFMEMYRQRPDSGPRKDDIVLFMYWFGKQADIYLDTSGETLTRHGYRIETTGAPMQETLAAAIIDSTKWNRDSHFINPMCGSGTLAIEAAMMALNKYPGELRKAYCFQKTRNYDRLAYENVKAKYGGGNKRELPFKIIATDADRKAVEAAVKNAKRAGVDHLISFKVCDFKDTFIPSGEGVVILNPEYGERLGAGKDLEAQYRQIGDFFKQKCTGKTGYIFTGNLDAAKRIGLRTSRRQIFYNGRIECRLLEYEIF